MSWSDSRISSRQSLSWTAELSVGDYQRTTVGIRLGHTAARTSEAMAPPTNRTEILQKLRAQVKSGQAIVGGGAGVGLSAKFAEQGGIDMIIIYNSGRFRMAGHGSLAGLLPYGNANGSHPDPLPPLLLSLDMVLANSKSPTDIVVDMVSTALCRPSMCSK